MTTIVEPIKVQGRLLGPCEIEEILCLLDSDPPLSRSAISRRLCERWSWNDESGRAKDMACRTMLRKLEARGLIKLPPPRHCGRGCRMANPSVAHDSSPIECDLSQLMPVSLEDAQASSQCKRLFCHLLATYHYLGMRDVGRNMKYLFRDRHGRPLACMLFGSAAWMTRPRDEFIGWDAMARSRNLQCVTNNTRFLILPWVKAPNLASFVLSRALQRLPRDWLRRYATPLALVETFVDRSRFEGTCYRAANWIRVGQTKGRSRQGDHNDPRVPIKDIYLYPVHKNFRELLAR